MPSDPERPIEKLLRAAAKERRDKAGSTWEIHPANRRLLQQEVARRFGKPPGPAPGFLAWLLGRGWFRPLGASAALAVLLLGAWFLLPVLMPKRIGPLAANKEQFQNTPEPVAAPRQSAAFQPPEVGKDSRSSLDEVAKAEKESIAPKPLAGIEANSSAASGGISPTPVLPPPALEAERRYGLSRGLRSATAQAPAREQLEAGTPSLQNELALAKKVSPQVANLPVASSVASQEAPQSNLAAVSEPSASSNEVVQYGYFIASRSLGSIRALQQISPGNSGNMARAGRLESQPPIDQILASFRVEQSGPELRVIDSDGSVYAGPIQATNAFVAPVVLANQTRFADALTSAKNQNPAAVGLGVNVTQQSAAASAFHVVGTNRSSNQRVTFSGTITGDTNVLAMTGTNLVQAGGALANAIQLSNAQAVPANLNLHLSGKAVIGRNQEIEIDAVPTPQPQNSK
jgi:hypothetical protein